MEKVSAGAMGQFAMRAGRATALLAPGRVGVGVVGIAVLPLFEEAGDGVRHSLLGCDGLAAFLHGLPAFLGEGSEDLVDALLIAFLHPLAFRFFLLAFRFFLLAFLVPELALVLEAAFGIVGAFHRFAEHSVVVTSGQGGEAGTDAEDAGQGWQGDEVGEQARIGVVVAKAPFRSGFAGIYGAS